MLPIRPAVRILLLNDADELLLMRTDDPNTTDIDGKQRGPIWYTIGGGVEEGESLLETAAREAFEEAGIPKEAIAFGPIVWYNSRDLILRGVPVHIQNRFILARTRQREFSLDHLTPEERDVVQTLAWFSLEKLRSCPETIYPRDLLKHLPDLLAGKIPSKPIEVL